MSRDTKTLNHSTWDCQYHVVFTPKYRKKSLYGMIRRDLKDVLHRLARVRAAAPTSSQSVWTWPHDIQARHACYMPKRELPAIRHRPIAPSD